MSAVSNDLKAILGKPREGQDLANFQPDEEKYKGQGEYRVVKSLLFAWQVLAPNPMMPGQEMVMEQTAPRGSILHIENIGKQGLKEGEKWDHFYTTTELQQLRPNDRALIYQRGIPEGFELPQPGSSTPATPEGTPANEQEPGGEPNFSEWGSHELAEYINQNKPNVQETVDMAQGDPDAAKRVLEAENIATENDPRDGVVKGLSKIIGEGRQQ